MNKTKKKKSPEKLSQILPLWAVALIFVCTTIIFFWPQLSGETFFWEDFVEYVYPTQTYAARAFAQGEVPVWNPYVFGGMPFLADLQVGFFYPMNRLLSLFVDSNGHLSHWALQFITILHFFLAQLGTYLLARYLKISSYSSLIPAVSFAFCYGMVMHVIHPMVVYHLAWLPWVVWMFLSGIDYGNLRSAALGGLILGMSFLAGHPQTALYEGLFLFVLMLWRWFDKKGLEKDFESNSGLKWMAPLITFALAAGVFAIQLLPTQELAEVAKRSDATYEYVTEGSMQTSDLAKLIVPGIKGEISWDNPSAYYFEYEEGNLSRSSYFYWEKGLYVGLAALVLGITAFVLMYRHPFIRFLICFTVFGILFAYGSNGFVFDIFYNLPFFDTFRFPIRMMFLVMFCLALASGYAVDKLKSIVSKGIRREVVVVNSVLGFVMIVAMLVWSGVFHGSLGTPDDMKPLVQSHAGSVIVAILVLGFILAALYFHKIKDSIAIMLIFLFVFFDLYFQGSGFNSHPQDGFAKYDLQNEFRTAFAAESPGDIFRVNMRLYDPPYMAMQRNQGLIDKIMLLEGYNPLQLDRIMPSFPTKKDVHGALNVRYELGIDKPTGRPRFYERREDIAPAWVVRDIKISSGKENTIELMSGLPEDSFRHVAVIEQEDHTNDEISLGSFEEPTAADIVRVDEYSNDYIKYSTESSSDGILIFSEIYYPSWNTYIDGEEVPMFIANGSLRAIKLPEGNHEVELVYESSALRTGTIITLFAFIAGLVLVFVPFGSKFSGSQNETHHN